MANLGFYDSSNLLSNNSMLIYGVAGPRGDGKTTEFIKRVVRHFINKGEKFIYLRRNEIDLNDSIPVFFDPLYKIGLYNEYEFEYKKHGRVFDLYIKDKNGEKLHMGWGVPLSTSIKIKSVSFINVKYIFFDEFLANVQLGQKYLPNEYEVFDQFISTALRPIDEKLTLKLIKEKKLPADYTAPDPSILLAANTISISNPYFDLWKVTNYNASIHNYFHDTVRFEITDKVPLDVENEENKFTRYFNQTGFSKNNIGTAFPDIHTLNIKKRTIENKCLYNISFNNQIYGVYKDGDDLIIDEKTDTNFKTYVLDRNSDTYGENKINETRSLIKNNLIAYFKYNKINYQNIQTRNSLVAIFRELF